MKVLKSVAVAGLSYATVLSATDTQSATAGTTTTQPSWLTTTQQTVKDYGSIDLSSAYEKHLREFNLFPNPSTSTSKASHDASLSLSQTQNISSFYHSSNISVYDLSTSAAASANRSSRRNRVRRRLTLHGTGQPTRAAVKKEAQLYSVWKKRFVTVERNGSPRTTSHRDSAFSVIEVLFWCTLASSPVHPCPVSPVDPNNPANSGKNKNPDFLPVGRDTRSTAERGRASLGKTSPELHQSPVQVNQGHGLLIQDREKDKSGLNLESNIALLSPLGKDTEEGGDVASNGSWRTKSSGSIQDRKKADRDSSDILPGVKKPVNPYSAVLLYFKQARRYLCMDQYGNLYTKPKNKATEDGDLEECVFLHAFVLSNNDVYYSWKYPHQLSESTQSQTRINHEIGGANESSHSAKVSIFRDNESEDRVPTAAETSSAATAAAEGASGIAETSTRAAGTKSLKIRRRTKEGNGISEQHERLTAVNSRINERRDIISPSSSKQQTGDEKLADGNSKNISNEKQQMIEIDKESDRRIPIRSSNRLMDEMTSDVKLGAFVSKASLTSRVSLKEAQTEQSKNSYSSPVDFDEVKEESSRDKKDQKITFEQESPVYSISSHHYAENGKNADLTEVPANHRSVTDAHNVQESISSNIPNVLESVNKLKYRGTSNDSPTTIAGTKSNGIIVGKELAKNQRSENDLRISGRETTTNEKVDDRCIERWFLGTRKGDRSLTTFKTSPCRGISSGMLFIQRWMDRRPQDRSPYSLYPSSFINIPLRSTLDQRKYKDRSGKFIGGETDNPLHSPASSAGVNHRQHRNHIRRIFPLLLQHRGKLNSKYQGLTGSLENTITKKRKYKRKRTRKQMMRDQGQVACANLLKNCDLRLRSMKVIWN